MNEDQSIKVSAAHPLELCRFLCALQPGCYESWAATWANIIKPGGILITYQYPLETVELGCKCPPWPLSKQLYSELLTAQGDCLAPLCLDCAVLAALPELVAIAASCSSAHMSARMLCCP